MATAPDFESKREELERQLGEIESDLAREAHARITGEGDPEAVEALRSKAASIRQEIAELDGAQTYDAALRAQLVERERLAQRRQEAAGFKSIVEGLVAKAQAIEHELPLSRLGAGITDFHDDQNRAFDLWVRWIEEPRENRKTERVASIRRDLGFVPIAKWLEGQAYDTGMLPISGKPSSWISLSDMTLTEIVTARVETALKHAVREFPELGEG